MNYLWIGFLGTLFVGFTTINRVLGGEWISSQDVGIMNKLSITSQLSLGFISIPIPSITFLNGLFHMMVWDYSFFGGMGQLLQFFLYAITFMVAFFCFITIIGLGVNAIRGR